MKRSLILAGFLLATVAGVFAADCTITTKDGNTIKVTGTQCQATVNGCQCS